MPRFRKPQTEFAIVDGDDTLWLVEQLYQEARLDIRSLISDFGLDADLWESLERTLDVDRFQTFRFSPERFPGSCTLAYEALCDAAGISVDRVLEDRIRIRAYEVFEKIAPLAPGAHQMVQGLSERFALFLLTQGDPRIQEKRVADSRLSQWFDRIEITPHKDETSFKEVIRLSGSSPDRGWSIGNSVASDIVPAQRCGLRTILVEAHSWEFEGRHVDVDDHNIVHVDSLFEILDVMGAS